MHEQNVPHQTNMTRDISEAFPQASALVAVQNVSQLQNVSSFNLCKPDSLWNNSQSISINTYEWWVGFDLRSVQNVTSHNTQMTNTFYIKVITVSIVRCFHLQDSYYIDYME